jgi:hypothetical protein
MVCAVVSICNFSLEIVQLSIDNWVGKANYNCSNFWNIHEKPNKNNTGCFVRSSCSRKPDRWNVFFVFLHRFFFKLIFIYVFVVMASFTRIALKKQLAVASRQGIKMVTSISCFVRTTLI